MPQADDGTITLLCTDIEGSTRLLHELGDRYPALLAQHHQLLRTAFAQHDGTEFTTQGDAFYVAFIKPLDALQAAWAAQSALESHAWPAGTSVKVRMGVHTGRPTLVGHVYVGLDVHRAARLCSAGHGGQVLVSQATHDAIQPQELTFKDLGEHRLKDLQSSERIFELVMPGLADHFPPLRTLTARRNNLPGQATPLVGRQQELDAARGLLLSEDVRLLTLIGPGGTGKTRLALEIAAEVMEEFVDGVWFVPLAATAEAGNVATAIARGLGILEASARQSLDAVKDYVGARQLLLCLDNFEHLLDAAPVVQEVLDASVRSKVLVTSRALLRLPQERHFEVPPLSHQESVRLFVERAQAAKADFMVTERSAPAVVEICNRVDGLPLGIELAAARVRLLPPETMLARMERRLPLLTGGPRDVPERHQTLRAAISWSHELLSDQEQALFRRLPVFAGGSSIEAAEAVCGGTQSAITSLVEQSLLRRETTPTGEPRLLMLETIREFALEQLEASGEGAEVRRQHALFFVELAEAAEPKLQGPEHVIWRDRLEFEHDNLRAALAWSRTTSEGTELGLRLGGALLWFWLVRGYFDEGLRALEAGLAAGDVPLSVRVKALTAAGHLANLHPDFASATKHLTEAMALATILGDERAAARAQSLLGETARFRGQYDVATARLQEALARLRRVGDHWGTYHTLLRLGETAREQGHLERATELHEESLAMRREVNDTRGIAGSLYSLGLLALARGDIGQATLRMREALATNHAVGSKVGIAICLESMAEIALANDEPIEAARLLGAVEGLLELVGGTLHWGSRPRYERDLAEARKRLDPHKFEVAQAEGRAMDLEEAIAQVLNGVALARG